MTVSTSSSTSGDGGGRGGGKKPMDVRVGNRPYSRGCSLFPLSMSRNAIGTAKTMLSLSEKACTRMRVHEHSLAHMHTFSPFFFLSLSLLLYHSLTYSLTLLPSLPLPFSFHLSVPYLLSLSLALLRSVPEHAVDNLITLRLGEPLFLFFFFSSLSPSRVISVYLRNAVLLALRRVCHKARLQLGEGLGLRLRGARIRRLGSRRRLPRVVVNAP